MSPVRLPSLPGLAALNDTITGQAAFVGVIDQFEVMMIAMLVVSPLVLFLRKPRPASEMKAVRCLCAAGWCQGV